MKIKPVEPKSATVAEIEPTQTSEANPSQTTADTFCIDENEDGTISFPLVDGTIVTMRELLTEDVIKIEQFVLQNNGQAGSGAITMKLLSMLCLKWGDRDGISYDALLKTPMRIMAPNTKRVNKVFEFFRLDDLLQG